MNYRIKDLIITIVPEHMKISDCDGGSSGGCTGTCSNADSDCPGGCSNGDTKFCGSSTSKDMSDPWDKIIDPADLVEMKSMLEHAVARFDAMTNKEEPKKVSKEEAEVLEKKLLSALTAIKEQRSRRQ